MIVREIMNPAPIVVRMDQKFAEGFQIMLESRHSMLPVVDADGTYRGIFDVRDVWTLLLPKAARVLDRKSIDDLSFAFSSLERLREQIADVADEPISDFVSKEDPPPVYTDTPVLQAILLLYQHGQAIPVIERSSGKLAGVLATWQVLEVLRSGR